MNSCRVIPGGHGPFVVHSFSTLSLASDTTAWSKQRKLVEQTKTSGFPRTIWWLETSPSPPVAALYTAHCSLCYGIIRCVCIVITSVNIAGGCRCCEVLHRCGRHCHLDVWTHSVHLNLNSYLFSFWWVGAPLVVFFFSPLAWVLFLSTSPSVSWCLAHFMMDLSTKQSPWYLSIVRLKVNSAVVTNTLGILRWKGVTALL